MASEASASAAVPRRILYTPCVSGTGRQVQRSTAKGSNIFQSNDELCSKHHRQKQRKHNPQRHSRTVAEADWRASQCTLYTANRQSATELRVKVRCAPRPHKSAARQAQWQGPTWQRQLHAVFYRLVYMMVRAAWSSCHEL